MDRVNSPQQDDDFYSGLDEEQQQEEGETEFYALDNSIQEVTPNNEIISSVNDKSTPVKSILGKKKTKG